jgi:phenylpropionate dioxygenase-like ring-hydroxylating dioxygenase large terminal subunit
MATSLSSAPHRWRALYPDLGTGPLPVETVLSPDVFEQQRRHVFEKVWLQVGRVESIAQPGDYFVAEIQIAKTSVIIVRQPGGTIGAFHNVCMHRGNKLAWQAKGKCGKFLTCNFHGWVFDTKGQLASVPDAENFYDLDKSALSLRPVRVDVWEGFIFINLDAQGTETLSEFLGELGQRLTGYPFAKLSTRTLWRTQVRSNWRLIADAQVETYHVPYLHHNTEQGVFSGPANPHAHVHHFEAFGPHHMISIPFNPLAVPKGVEALAFQFGSSLVQAGGRGEFEMPEGLNPSKASNWQFDIYHFFPNFNILAFRDLYATHQFWPLSVDQSVWEVSLNQPVAATAAERFAQEQAKCLFREAVSEDGSTHERTQEALESGVLKQIHLKDEEIAVRHGYVTLDRMIAAGEAAA